MNYGYKTDLKIHKKVHKPLLSKTLSTIAFKTHDCQELFIFYLLMYWPTGKPISFHLHGRVLSVWLTINVIFGYHSEIICILFFVRTKSLFTKVFHICVSQVYKYIQNLNGAFLVSFYLMYEYKYVFDMQTKKFPP